MIQEKSIIETDRTIIVQAADVQITYPQDQGLEEQKS